MKKFAPILIALALGACANTKMLAEKGDTAAADLYIATVTSLNSYATLPNANVAALTVLKAQAKAAWQAERATYVKYGTVNLTDLQQVSCQVKNLVTGANNAC